MTAIEKLLAINTVTVIDQNDKHAQQKIDTLEKIHAYYFIKYEIPNIKIGEYCIVL